MYYQDLIDILNPKINTSFSLKCYKVSQKQYLKEIFIYYDTNFNRVEVEKQDSCNKDKDISILIK